MRACDAADTLRPFRARFALPEDVIYLDGNSLGALPRETMSRAAAAIADEWGRGLIRSWNESGWIEAPRRLGAKIARIIGASPDEVIVADSTSVNLFKLLTAALRARPGRQVILTEEGNFPTDLYIAEGAAALMPGIELRAVARGSVVQALSGDVAVVMLTHVHYKTGERFDMNGLTAAAHAQGALVLWDLSHSTGAIPVDLTGAHADLAVGCGYKYLNGGPGAPAYLFVARHLHAELHSPLTGWMGHAAPFAFAGTYAPAPGLARFLCGTPPIIAMAALEAGLDLFLDADMQAIARKSAGLCGLFINLVEQRCAGFGLQLATPREAAHRGSHVAFRHPQAHAIMQALIAAGVIGDFRDPDILRFGLTPLYVGYEDVWNAVGILSYILAEAVWAAPIHAARKTVT